MKARMARALNLVSFSASNYSAVVLTLLNRTIVHRRYLPNNVGTHLQLSIYMILKIVLPPIMSCRTKKSDVKGG